jgi:hypothetical protein
MDLNFDRSVGLREASKNGFNDIERADEAFIFRILRFGCPFMNPVALAFASRRASDIRL